jgi:PiT family inorganic phosphate transporter
MPDLLVWSIILLALAFDYVNGFHDAANSIATVVSTRVLSPRWAVIWAAFFNFIAFLFFGLHVAKTIGKGTIDPAAADPAVIASALAGGVAWDPSPGGWASRPARPTPSSGPAGAAIVKAGFPVLDLMGLLKVGSPSWPPAGPDPWPDPLTAVFWIFRATTLPG